MPAIPPSSSREPQLTPAPDFPRHGAPALPTRFRFASGSSRGSNTQGDLEAQLRQRLRPTASHDLIFLRRVELGAIAAVIITNFAVFYFDFPSFAPSLPDANISLGAYSAAICSLGVVAYGVLIPKT